MKKLPALPILAVLCLALMPAASGQNLPASMAFPDCTTSGNLQFLDVNIAALNEFPAHKSLAENAMTNPAKKPEIAHSSAAVLSALGLLGLAIRRR